MKRIILVTLLVSLGILLTGTTVSAHIPRLPPVTFNYVNTQSSTGTIDIAWTMAPSVTKITVDVDGTTINYGPITSYGRQGFTLGTHTFTVTPSDGTKIGRAATLTVAIS